MSNVVDLCIKGIGCFLSGTAICCFYQRIVVCCKAKPKFKEQNLRCHDPDIIIIDDKVKKDIRVRSVDPDPIIDDKVKKVVRVRSVVECNTVISIRASVWPPVCKDKEVTIKCNPNQSGLFLGMNDIGSDEMIPKRPIPSIRDFSGAVRQWKKKNKVKSLQKFAANGHNDLLTFYKIPAIGGYLSRRELKCKRIGVEEWKIQVLIPALTHYERKLYKGLSAFGADDSKQMHYGQKISFRCAKNVIEDCMALAQAKKKRPEMLHPINFFLFSGMSELESTNLIEINSKLFYELKKQDSIKYQGLHYLPFINIFDYYSGRLSSNPGQILFQFISDLHGKLVPLDNCPINIIMHQMCFYGHAFVCMYILDTKDINDVGLIKIIAFDSWVDKGVDGSTQAFKESFGKLFKIEDIFQIIYYGAQEGPLDPNCSLYAINAMNALVKLLSNDKIHIDEDWVDKFLESSKRELQLALPEYFGEESGEIYLKALEERLLVHAKDRWIMGNVMVEGFMKGQIRRYKREIE